MISSSRLFAALVGGLTALPAPTLSEGNRLVLACEMLTPAPADEAPSDEAPAEEAVPTPANPQFLIAPVKTDRDGVGEIQATGPDGGPYAGVTASHQGPFAWTAGTVLNTLTVEGTAADGRALVLWHRLDQAQAAAPPAGHLNKLLCEVS
ncbi:MAG: hypothetical protein KDK53_00210 [Maritimibacter sp.]|nr:hypothetical protein [Maritimibacter sp.]